MINVLIIGFIVMAVFVIAFLSLKVRRCGIGILRKYFRGAIKCTFTASCFLLVTCSGLILCYTSVSDILKSTLSPESVEKIKLFARVLTGVDSVFVALQSLAFASFMVSAVSCFVYLCGKLTVYAYSDNSNVSGTAEKEKNIGIKCFSFHAPKTFLVYSKFNS